MKAPRRADSKRALVSLALRPCVFGEDFLATIHFQGRIKSLTPAQKRQVAVDRRRLRYELGTLVQTWSQLQGDLAGIFHQATGCEPHVSNSMWHSLKSDLAQRELVSAALRSQIQLLSAWKNDKDKQDKAKVFAEYLWLIGEITKFSHKRNDLIHSPIVLFRSALSTEMEAIIDGWHDDPRAKRLKDTELYQYCRWQIGFCEDAHKFMRSIWTHLRKHEALPKRPQWRSLSLFPTRKQPPHQKTRQPRPRPHRSSRA